MKYLVAALLLLVLSTTAFAGSILYAPSEPDNPAWRSAISGFTGEACDYFDGRAGTPTLAQLLTYDMVYTWADFAFLDPTGFGDVLADYVDAGGRVLLGQWCTPTDQANALGGRILNAPYLPFSATTSYLSSSYAGDGTTAIFAGVGAITTDYMENTSLNPGFLGDGTYLNGYPFVGWRADGRVFQATGLNEPYAAGDTARLVANISQFQVASAVPLPATALLLGEIMLLLAGVRWVRRRR